MVELSERGITLTKGLAWSIVSGAVAVAFGGGVLLTTINATATQAVEGLGALQGAVEEEQRDRAAEMLAITGRVTSLENAAAGRDVHLQTLLQAVGELRSDSRETQRLLRELISRQAGR
jgi:uncharacterized coiled-coil protein SlyX